TIATNMAGRGTDILLGGNPDFMTREFLKEQEVDPDEANESQWQQEFKKAKRIVEAEHKEVVSLGGLPILGTERHESRRINNQRETIYGLRRKLMEEPDQREYLLGETGVARDLFSDITKQYLDANASPDDWDIENYKVQIHTVYALDLDAEGIDFQNSTPEE